MELNQVIDFIKEADPETRTIIRAELKRKPTRTPVKEVCNEDIKRLITVLPFTSDEFKGYRYDTTSVTYIRYIRELADLITHNYICKHNTRGYPVWVGAEDVSEGREDEYKAVFNAITNTVIAQMAMLGTRYPHPDYPKNP